jgi:hypothetical protein
MPINAGVIAEVPCKCDVSKFQETGEKENEREEWG